VQIVKGVGADQEPFQTWELQFQFTFHLGPPLHSQPSPT